MSKKLKIFEVYIKSHCEAPDYENEIEASSKREAIRILLKRFSKWGWTYSQFESYVHEVKKNGSPF